MNNTLVVCGQNNNGINIAKTLKNRGYSTVTLCSASSDGRLYGCKGDPLFMDDLFRKYRFNAVIDASCSRDYFLAASNPAAFYRNNLSNTLALLDMMLRHGIKNYVFLSSADIYNISQPGPFSESSPLAACNPYTRSFFTIEQVLGDYARLSGLNSISLRYFNTHEPNITGENAGARCAENNLVHQVIQAALGGQASVLVNGRDHHTPSGTLVRDYLHVDDLAQGCLLALQTLLDSRTPAARCYNLGSDQGYSVAHLLATARRILQQDGYTFTLEEGEHNPRLCSHLVLNCQKAKQELGWHPRFGLDDIVSYAWNTHKKRVLANALVPERF